MFKSVMNVKPIPPPSLPPSLPPPLPQFANKCVFMMSLISNRGILHNYKLSKHKQQRELLAEMFLHPAMRFDWLYLCICFLGIVLHEFVYCLLVRACVCVCVCVCGGGGGWGGVSVCVCVCVCVCRGVGSGEGRCECVWGESSRGGCVCV